MILLLAIGFGLAATLLRAGLKHRTLKLRKLRWEWLVFLSVLPQIFVFQIPITSRWVPEAIIPYIQIVTMIGLIIFVSANLRVPGFWALGTGLAANFLVIVLNGGWMPISRVTLNFLTPSKPTDFWVIGTRLGLSKDYIMNSLSVLVMFLSLLVQLFCYGH